MSLFKKVLIIIAVTVGLILVAVIGRADSIIPQDKPRGYTTGTIIDHYERISDIVEIKDSIHLNIKCTTELVPIIVPGRRARTATPGEMLGGAVIGGVLGKLLTNKDKGAIGGAIIGGLATQNRRQSDTIQYKEISSCRDVPRYKIVTKDDYSHSTINFTLDGISYNARFIKHGL
jgi:uncharacterized protein YcfJ